MLHAVGINDLKDVIDVLFDVSRKWYYIGLQLNIQVDILENIKHQESDDSNRLREMLIIWLKQVNPLPSWEALVSALKGRTVGEAQLAEQIQQKYCNTTQGKICIKSERSSICSVSVYILYFMRPRKLCNLAIFT